MSVLLGCYAAVAFQVPLPPVVHTEPLRDRVTLTLTSDRAVYLVGETLRLVLTAYNTSPSPVIGNFMLDPRAGRARVHYRRAGGSFVELNRLDAARDAAQQYTSLDSSAAVSADFVIARDPSGQGLLLDEAGEYEFFVQYGDLGGPNGLLESNVLRISVADVPADEQAALIAYRRGLALFSEPGRTRWGANEEQIAAAAEFLERYPGSVYWRDVRGGLYSVLRQRVQRHAATDIERALFQSIESEWVDDSRPPALGVSAAPDRLWPPNHKLVGVEIMVTVEDDTDRDPEVKLVSITCDDNCDSAADIAGAAYDTDDRDFELRAERKGSGEGRTYTITYSATDSSGNTSSATTTVVVPHDQGVRAWSGDAVAYKVGDRVSHEGHTWRCFQAHRSQPDWSPPRTPALWIKLPVSTNWDYPVQYALDEEVTYEGARYRCRQAHTSQAGWTPPSTPALWTRAN